MNQLYTYMYPLFFLDSFSHLGQYRILSRALCAIWQLIISYILYIVYVCVCVYIYIYICMYVYSNLPFIPSPPLIP